MQFPKLCLTVLCTVLCLTTLSAQNDLLEGYYVDLNKDTVRGFFNLDGLDFSKILYYADKTTHESKKLTPETVQYIETKDKVSIRSFVYLYNDKKEPIFIRKYADGDVVLYKANTSNPNEPDVFFISSVKIPEIRKINPRYPKMFFKIYFKGCELPETFSVKYTENSLLAAVTEISKCAHPDKQIIREKGKTNKVSVAFGVKTGVFLNESQIGGWLGGEPKILSTVKPIVGIVAVLDVANGLKIYTGLNYFNRELNAPEPFQFPYGIYCFKAPSLALSVNLLEIPFALHYEFKKMNSSFVPKVFAGASFLIPTQHTINIKLTECYGRSQRYEFLDDVYEKGKRNPSFFVGLGMKKVLKNKTSVELNLKYAFESDDISAAGSIASNRYEIALGYLIPLAKQ